MLQPDLKTREGCVHYVETQILPTLVKTFTKMQQLHPHGVVFAMQLEGKRFPNPEPKTVGQVGLRGRELRRALQKASEQLAAVGSVFVRADEFKRRNGTTAEVVVVQLEHKSFADLVWTAPLEKDAIGPFTGPLPLAQADVDVKPLRFLSARWMS